MQELVNAGVISRMDYDQATAQQKATEANVAEIRATIERKTIRAPFSGILGIRQVNLGQYLSAGEGIVPPPSLNPIFVNIGAPQQTAPPARGGRNASVFRNKGGGPPLSGGRAAPDVVVNHAH